MYPILNPYVAGRATRDLGRLHQEIVQLAVEAANGVADEGDAAKIEQDLIAYRQIAEGLAAYARAAYKEGIKKAEAAAAQAQAAEKAKAAEAAEKAGKESEPAAEEA